MEQSPSDLQAARLAAKQARRASFEAHPFGRQLAAEPDLVLYDDKNTAARSALVAIPGNADKMGGIPAVDLFDQVDDLPIRRLFLRGLALGTRDYPLGSDVVSVSENLAAMLAGHDRVVFAGASVGGFLALLLGSLVRADAILGFGPTTSLDPAFLDQVGDRRFEHLDDAHDPEWTSRYGDPTRFWDSGYAPDVTIHYGYRNDSTRPHAERMADFPNVRLKPHYELTLMAKIRDNGELRADLRRALGC